MFQLQHIFDLIGVTVFAVSGALAAGRKRLDLIGVVVLALATAVGGGTIRDVLLGRHPIFWLSDSAYVIVIVASALATVLFARGRRPPYALLLVADGLGLAMFSVVGAQIAERAGLPAAGCIVLGAVTGAAGGALRDVLVNEVPLVLRRGELYATAAIAGTSAYFAFLAMGTGRQPATIGGMVIVGAVRFAAIWWRLQLPEFSIPATGEHPTPDRPSGTDRR